MPLLLGIDTGGTYTDAVIYDDAHGVVATAKALTTRHDLGVGLSEAARAVLKDSGTPPEDIVMVSISTTLATNALVEGQGGRVALILVGFSTSGTQRAKLEQALRGDPCISIAGGHDAHGEERSVLDLEALDEALQTLPEDVAAFAVASMFAVRNPAHEQALRERLSMKTGLPVTCSHELSSRLDGPRRALTCVLNARLLPMIDRLLSAADDSFRDLGVSAPIMVVRGDGALIRAQVARERPVETILSGPAASLVGAAHLAGASSAIVSDIGGTTTDYALMEDGRPQLHPDGAEVGGFRTMVEAVAMQTVGLGGDSEVVAAPQGLKTQLVLGPRRLIPVSLLATQFESMVHDTLNRQSKGVRRGESIGRFVVPAQGAHVVTSNPRELELLERLGNSPKPLDELLNNQREHGTLNVMVARGLVQLCGVTPSDAAHVLKLHDAWDAKAALAAMTLFAEQKSPLGLAIAEDPLSVAEDIIESLAQRSARALLGAALRVDGAADESFADQLLGTLNSPESSLVKTQFSVSLPVVALGASAHVYYPRVAQLLSTQPIVPSHADVANAVGAVVGQIRIRAAGTITMPADERYRVFAGGAPEDFSSLDSAVSHAKAVLEEEAIARAQAAGSYDLGLSFERIDKTAVVEGRATLVESAVAMVASGRPRFARQ